MPKNTIDIYDNIKQIVENALRDHYIAAMRDTVASRIAHDVASFLDEAPVTVLHPGDDPISTALTVAAEHLYADGAFDIRRAVVTMTADGVVRVDTDTTHDVATGTH